MKKGAGETTKSPVKRELRFGGIGSERVSSARVPGLCGWLCCCLL